MRLSLTTLKDQGISFSESYIGSLLEGVALDFDYLYSPFLHDGNEL